MSKTKHKIKIKDSNGFTYTVPLFTELKDLKHNKGKPIKVLENKKLITLYYPIGEVNDPESTPGKIKDSKGNVFALLNTGTPPYKEVFFVNKNSDKSKDYTGTFVVPAGVSRIRVALCTGGANHKKEQTTDSDGDYIENEVYTIGRDTYFGEISAIKKKQKEYYWGCKPSFSFSDLEGHQWNERFIHDYFYNPPEKSEYYGFSRGRWDGDFARGYYYSGYIDVTPNQKINYRVGGSDYTNRDSTDGLFEWNCGFILIAYGIGIEK